MRRSLSWLLLFAVLAGTAYAEEIRLQTCDLLPVVEVSVSGVKFLFLVDTAATSFLNLKSFAHGADLKLPVTSWSGTMETRAQQVTIGDLSVGEHHFRNLKLPAIDLSAIGRACGRRLDGIFGIDLLRQLGASVDLHQGAPRLLVAQEDDQTQASEVETQWVSCEQAWNRADESAFSDCLDPDVVALTAAGDLYGHTSVMEFVRRDYFHQHPPAQVSIALRASHALGEAIWVEYDLRVAASDGVVVQRGSALCHKRDGKWRAVLLIHSDTSEMSTGSGK